MVSVLYYNRLSTGISDRIDIPHKLARRMSSMQKLSLKLFLDFKESNPDIFEKIKSDLNIPVIFTSAFGEIEAIYNTVKDVSEKNIPVSPTAFQHSVDNATAGYIAMVFKIHNKSLTISKGYLSMDNALFFASRSIESGSIPMALIVNANEYLWQNEEKVSDGEIILLCKENFEGINPLCSINSCDFGFEYSDGDSPSSDIILKEENDYDKALYLNLDKNMEDHTRIAVSKKGEYVKSVWSSNIKRN